MASIFLPSKDKRRGGKQWKCFQFERKVSHGESLEKTLMGSWWNGVKSQKKRFKTGCDIQRRRRRRGSGSALRFYALWVLKNTGKWRSWKQTYLLVSNSTARPVESNHIQWTVSEDCNFLLNSKVTGDSSSHFSKKWSKKVCFLKSILKCFAFSALTCCCCNVQN